MNEYTFQIWGKIFGTSFSGEERPMSYGSSEVVTANDGEEAMRKAKKMADRRWNYWEIRDFRKL